MSHEILITGYPFAGTAAVARMLHNIGVDLGRGPLNMYYEARDVQRWLVHPYLRSVGADPRGQDPLPKNHKIEHDWAKRVRAVLGGVRKPWAYADAKLVLMAPQWIKAFPDAKWIVCRDDPWTVTHRIMDKPYMTAFQEPEQWYRWLGELDAYCDDVIEQTNALEVEAGQVGVDELAMFCGLV